MSAWDQTLIGCSSQIRRYIIQLLRLKTNTCLDYVDFININIHLSNTNFIYVLTIRI